VGWGGAGGGWVGGGARNGLLPIPQLKLHVT
jgi:hypothetical protein